VPVARQHRIYKLARYAVGVMASDQHIQHGSTLCDLQGRRLIGACGASDDALYGVVQAHALPLL